MKIVKNMDDVKALDIAPNIRDVVKAEFEALTRGVASVGGRYNPDRDGYVALIERGDTRDTIEREIGTSLMDVLWEGVKYVNAAFVGVTLFNNEYGLTIIIPDASWLDARLRAKLFHESNFPIGDGKS